MNALAIRFLALGLGLATALPASADTVTIWASHDTTLFQNEVDNSDGGGPALYAGTNGSISPRRTLLFFDIAGNLPAGATITSAQLTLTLGQVAGTGGGSMGTGAGQPHVIRLYPLTQSWGEGNNGAGSPIMMSGGGFPANTNDATWNARFYPSTVWNAAGGDFVATSSSQTTVSGTTVNIPFTWPSSTQLVADVQGWLDNSASNFGWMLKNDDETVGQTYYAFYSREWTGGASTLPQLVVTYTTVPEPQMAGIFGVATLLGLRCRRNKTKS